VHYNTTQETGATLHHLQTKAVRQEDHILRYFQSHPGQLFSPSQVNRVFPQMILNSVRRAITNLTTEGHLLMSSEKRRSVHGHPEHCWYYPKQSDKRVVGGDLPL
jgi:hypothetical protein